MALLWLQLAAVAPIRPLAWEPPYALSVALKNKNMGVEEGHGHWLCQGPSKQTKSLLLLISNRISETLDMFKHF